MIVDKVLVCHCGFEARAADEEALVEQVQRHAREAHAMTLSHDEAMLVAFRAELDAIARDQAPRPEKEEK